MGNVSLINRHIDEPKGMTDNEIIKAFERITQYQGFTSSASRTLKETLDLINRQKAEIEKFKNRQKPTAASGYKIENGKIVFFTNMLGGCKIVKENLDEVVKTLNELLQECYSKDEIAFALKCKTEELKTAKVAAVKEFALELKRIPRIAVYKNEIDNLLKEKVGE